MPVALLFWLLSYDHVVIWKTFFCSDYIWRKGFLGNFQLGSSCGSHVLHGQVGNKASSRWWSGLFGWVTKNHVNLQDNCEHNTWRSILQKKNHFGYLLQPTIKWYGNFYFTGKKVSVLNGGTSWIHWVLMKVAIRILKVFLQLILKVKCCTDVLLHLWTINQDPTIALIFSVFLFLN